MRGQLRDMQMGPMATVTHPCAAYSTFAETATMTTFPPSTDTSGISYEWNVYDETKPSFTKGWIPGAEMCFGVVVQVYNPLIAAGIVDNFQATSAEIAAGTTGLTKFMAWHTAVTALPAGTEKTVKLLIYDIIVLLSYMFQFESASATGRAGVGTTYASTLFYEGMTGFPYSSWHTEFMTKQNTLYNTFGYATWDVTKNSTMPPFYPMTKYTAHITNILTMLPYNGITSTAATALNNLNLGFTDPTGYFYEIPQHHEFSVELVDGEYLPVNFSTSMPAKKMYRAMLTEYSFNDQVQKVVATPFACTYNGRRILNAMSTVLGYVNSGYCPTVLGLFGLLREMKEGIMLSEKAHAWFDMGTTGGAVYAAGVYNPEGYAAMAWYYRSIMTTAIVSLNTTCGQVFDVAWVGFVIGAKYYIGDLQNHLLDMHMGP